jgi:hypothetical protein
MPGAAAAEVSSAGYLAIPDQKGRPRGGPSAFSRAAAGDRPQESRARRVMSSVVTLGGWSLADMVQFT